MKNIIAAGLITALLFNCKKTETTIIKAGNDSAAVQQNEFIIDSVSVNDSIKVNENITQVFKSTVLVFPNITDKSLLDSIYSKENLTIDSYSKENLQNALQDKMKKYFADNKKAVQEYPGESKQTWNQNSAMKILQKDDRLMTVKYTGDGFTGGAHGYYYEFYKNFDLKNSKTLKLSDVLNTTDDKVWDPIMMKSFLNNKNYTSDLLFDKRIPLNDNFYFDKKSIHFVYGQYEIAPYAAGTINIEIPFTEISAYLKPEFKESYSIN